MMALTFAGDGRYTGGQANMLTSRDRMSRFLTDSRPVCDPVIQALSAFYREEFLKCQRCLEQYRECYSERAIREAETELTRVIANLDQLCASDNAEEVVGHLLQQFDAVAHLSVWSNPRQIH